MRRLIIPLLLLLALVFLFINQAEVQAVVKTLQRGEFRYLALALVVQIAWMFNTAACYRVVYRLLGMQESWRRLFLVSASANFVNVVAPTGGMGAVAVYVADAQRRGLSPARVAVACAVVILMDYLAFLSVLALGLVVLLRRNNLEISEIIAAAILAAAAMVLGLLIYLGMRSAADLGRALAWMARLVNRLAWPFTRRQYLSEERAHSFAYEAAGGLQQLRMQSHSLLAPLFLSLTGKLLLIIILTLVFIAFKTPFSLGTLVGGFSIGYLFWIVSPTPAGIGFVEGALTLGLRSLNVSLGDATVLTLAYRGVTFWLPFLFGMIALRLLPRVP